MAYQQNASFTRKAQHFLPYICSWWKHKFKRSQVALGKRETHDAGRETKFSGAHRPEVGQVSDWLTEKFFSLSHEGTDAGL